MVEVKKSKGDTLEFQKVLPLFLAEKMFYHDSTKKKWLSDNAFLYILME